MSFRQPFLFCGDYVVTIFFRATKFAYVYSIPNFLLITVSKSSFLFKIIGKPVTSSTLLVMDNSSFPSSLIR